LEEGCPRPIDPQKYSGGSYVYTGSLVPDQGRFKDRKWQGLFAIKDRFSPNTYVIATSGEVFALDGAGAVRILRPQ